MAIAACIGLCVLSTSLQSEAMADGAPLIKHVLAIPHLEPQGVEVKLWLSADPPVGTPVRLEVGGRSIDLRFGDRLFLPLPDAPRWTPDTPKMLTLRVRLGSEERTVRFGLRRVEARGEKLFLNGEPFYVRGFGCDGNDNGQLKRQVTTTLGFRNYVKRAKEFGFNVMRSHMPDNDRPQAFLDACDELGLFIWAEFEPDVSDVSQLAYYWNHPSVIWWCWGNEMAGIGTSPWAQNAYKFAHENDPSRLVMDNSGWGQYDRDTTDLISQHMGYYFPHGPRAQCYSSYALFTTEGSMKGKSMADLMQEMRDGRFRLGKPLLAHETGNHQAFPDIRRRAGRMDFSLRPKIVQKMNSGDRMGSLDRWVRASGRFKQAMDKIWIEQVRKSPIAEGFEMWMLADHGYVFAGVIEDGEDCRIKPNIDPALFRLHNAADVLLAEFPEDNFKRTFASGEQFTVQLLASVYGPDVLRAGKAVWKLTASGRTLAESAIWISGAQRGRVSVIGELRISAPKVDKPVQTRLSVEVPIGERKLSNSWNVWVYPDPGTPACGELKVVRDLSDETIDALARGGRALLILEDTKAIGRTDQAFASVLARFRPQMWEWGHNLGAHVFDHPALRWFPHSGFSDLQFYRPIDYGRKIVLDDCPFAPTPIVDAIDLPAASDSPEAYCRKATYLFELTVGKGRLLVTGFNFTPENLKHLEVRALWKSLTDYACGPAFAPATQVDPAVFRDYVRKPKANPVLGAEGYWKEIFYNDTELVGRNRFLDAGEEPPVVRPTRLGGAARFDGTYCSGKGNVGYLRMVDQSFSFFKPNPYRQNISMLYIGKEERLCENHSWYMWWIQNSYGPSYCSIPFLEEPWVTAMQNANDLWFKFQGDGKRVGSFPPVPAPDGSLCDCAGPNSVIYKQGDMDTSLHELHDWFYEGTAAGVVMQAEMLLVSRDMKAIRHYLPMLDRACNFVERTRDPRNGLFLVGPASNLLAPSYGGVLQPDGSCGKGYLAGLSVNYLAAVNRMIELNKMVGDDKKTADYRRRQRITRDSLHLLLAKDGYFCKSMEVSGKQHGVLGQKEFGYFEVAPNVDAVCFRAVDDTLARKIVAETTSIPELRPNDMLITNYPSLDDIYVDCGSTSQASQAVSKLMEYGKWVNGGVWTTMEARAIMAYARTGQYDDLVRSMSATLDFAKAFHLDAPLGSFGKSGWYPGTMGLCWDALGPPAAVARGLFEYIYKADSLVLYPHIPPSVTEYVQKQPIRFGAKKVYISVKNGGPNVVSVKINGKPVPVAAADHIELQYADLPSDARVEITTRGKWPSHVADADTSFVSSDPELLAPAELPDEMARHLKILQATLASLADGPGLEYERRFLSEAVLIHETYGRRKAMQDAGLFPWMDAAKHAGALGWYQEAASQIYAGIEAMMARCSQVTEPQKKLAAAFEQAQKP